MKRSAIFPLQLQNGSSRRDFSRRTFLKGVGVTMALPWLESLVGSRAFAAVDVGATGASGLLTEAGFPKRFAAVFMGCGVNPENWMASGSGPGMTLGSTLSPLEGIKSKINVMQGLFHKTATGLATHPSQTGNLLTGARITKGPTIHSGISIDQMLANRIGQDTPQPSMVLACEQAISGYHDSNYSNAYSSHISWQNADSPVPNEMYPSLAFDSLFENRGNLRNISVLDRVKERASELNRKISYKDKGRLDEYLTSVREVEKKIERMRDDKATAEDRAKGRPLLSLQRPENGLPEDLRDHTRLMCDIIAMGFQTDKTRIATLILARDLSSLIYPFLGVNGAHHGLSHNDTSESYESVVQFHISQYAYLLKRLDEMPEGDGTVLDNSCIMFLSNMLSGTNHDNRKLPVVLAGGLGGTLQTGRALNYLKAGDSNRKLCSMYLGIMDRMGVKLDQFGDADTRLAGL